MIHIYVYMYPYILIYERNLSLAWYIYTTLAPVGCIHTYLCIHIYVYMRGVSLVYDAHIRPQPLCDTYIHIYVYMYLSSYRETPLTNSDTYTRIYVAPV